MRLALAAVALALTLGAQPGTAQTRVSFAVRVHAPPLYGTVIVGAPRPMRRHGVIVVAPWYRRYRSLGGEVVLVRRGYPAGRLHDHRHHRAHRY